MRLDLVLVFECRVDFKFTFIYIEFTIVSYLCCRIPILGSVFDP